MFNRLNNLLYGFWGILIFVSCNEKKVEDGQLLRAEALMASSPDSSYRILRSVSPKTLSKPEQIHYGLLLAEATDKKYLSLLPCDSLLNEAIRYYNGGLKRAKALMYKGRLQSRMNMHKEAMENYFAALKELGETDKEELRIKGMIYEDLGNLYSDQVLTEKSTEMFQKAEDCFARCAYKAGLASVANDAGWNYLLQGNAPLAREHMKKGLEFALEQNDSAIIATIYHNLSCSYEDMDSILFYGKQSLAFSKSLASKSAIMIGYAYLNQEHPDSAEYYFRQALRDTLIETRALTLYGLKDVMDMEGELRQALEYLEDYSVAMDSIYFHKQSSEIERKIYEHEAEMKLYKDKVEMERRHLFLIIFCLLVIVFAVWYVQRVRRRKKILQLEYERDVASLKADIAGLQYYIASLRMKQEQDKAKISEKEREIRKLADEKAELCNVIFKKTPIYRKVEQLSRQEKTKKKQDLRILLEDEQRQLRLTIMDIYKDYIAYLRETYPKYTENDYIFLCLSLCGWDDFTIAFCFGNVNKQIVAQRRHRIKQKSEAQ